MKKQGTLTVSALALAVAVVVPSGAARSQDPGSSEAEIQKYREMISDPMSNPGFLAVDRGEALWSTKRGSKNVGLETCDLGEGPGKLEGAFAKLPRYFADADKVMETMTREYDFGGTSKTYTALLLGGEVFRLGLQWNNTVKAGTGQGDKVL